MKKFIPVIVGVAAVGAFLWNRNETQHQLARLRAELGERAEHDAEVRRHALAFANDVRVPLLARLTQEAEPRLGAADAERTAPSGSSEPASLAEPANRRTPANEAAGDESALLRESLEERLIAEEPDPAWTGDAERRAERQFEARLPPGSYVDAVECSATLCRMETTHEGGSAASQFVRTAFADSGERPWNGSFVVGPAETFERDGSVRLAVYLLREEHELPAGQL